MISSRRYFPAQIQYTLSYDLCQVYLTYIIYEMLYVKDIHLIIIIPQTLPEPFGKGQCRALTFVHEYWYYCSAKRDFHNLRHLGETFLNLFGNIRRQTLRDFLILFILERVIEILPHFRSNHINP